MENEDCVVCGGKLLEDNRREYDGGVSSHEGYHCDNCGLKYVNLPKSKTTMAVKNGKTQVIRDGKVIGEQG